MAAIIFKFFIWFYLLNYSKGEINGRLLDENEENMDLDSNDHPSIGRDLRLAAQNLIHQSHPRYKCHSCEPPDCRTSMSGTHMCQNAIQKYLEKYEMHLNLELDSLPYTIHRLDPSTPSSTYLPLVDGQFWFNITKTTEELCLVISHEFQEHNKFQLKGINHRINGGWRCFKVVGPLDFELVGILANLSNALAVNSISLFVVSTFDTDYILVKKDKVMGAKKVFEDIGHSVKEV